MLFDDFSKGKHFNFYKAFRSINLIKKDPFLKFVINFTYANL